MTSREEFETWVTERAKGTPSENYPKLLSRNTHDADGYQLSWVDCAWMGWKASRAALVIDLPQQSGVNLDWNQAIRYCHQAVEAAGVKVKS